MYAIPILFSPKIPLPPTPDNYHAYAQQLGWSEQERIYSEGKHAFRTVSETVEEMVSCTEDFIEIAGN